MSRKKVLRAHRIEQLENRQLLSGGYLDTSFNNDGLATASASGFSISATDTAVLSNGKVIVVGTATSNSTHNTFMEVARYNAGGSLDTMFGASGFVTSRVPGSAAGVAVQSDGKIVVVGTDQGSSEFKVVRFTANGDLDTSFNHTGVAVTTFDSNGSNSAFAAGVAIQKDGKIVVAGSAYTGGFFSSNFDAMVVRYNTNGLIDGNFGSGGKADIGLGDREYGEALTIDYAGNSSNNPDFGKIVVVGAAANTQDTTRKFLIARLQTNGQLDTSFHHTGKFSSAFVSEYQYSDARAVVVQASNQIVVVGSVGPTSLSAHNFGIIRLNPDGSGDGLFGPSNGQTEVDFGGNDAADSVVVSKTGDLLVGGVNGSKVALVALTSKGLIDKSFGPNGNGKVTTAGSGNIYGGGIALYPNGKFVVAGGSSFAVERYFDRATYTATIFAPTPNAYEAGQVPATFRIIITPNASATTRVFYTVSGTATSPFSILRSQVDYSGVNKAPLINSGGGSTGGFSHFNQGYVDIPAGQGFADVTLTPIDDSRPEGDESIILSLAPDIGYDINPTSSTATAVIHDNDAPQTIVNPTADAYVQDGSNAAKNFGTSQQLQVGKSSTTGNNRITYLKFDLTLAPSVINSAKLVIFGKLNNATPKNVPVGVYFVSNTSWTEGGINFNNKPALSSAALSTVNIIDTAVRGYEFDLTGYLQAQKSSGHNIVSVALAMPANSTNFAIFNSREGPVTTPMQLLIT